MLRHAGLYLAALAAVLAAGCNSIPTSGPTRARVEESAGAAAAAAVIQVVDVNDAITRRLLDQPPQPLFSETLGEAGFAHGRIGPGDFVEISIWEAAPATLFGGLSSVEARGTMSTSRAVTLPDQMVGAEGDIAVPFAGRIRAAGRTNTQVASDIAAALKGKANQPEVLVRVTRNLSTSVTVVGEVNTSTRVPLMPGNERLLDALAAAAGVKQPVGKTTIQVTRGKSVHSLPLQTIIRDPRQNIPLQPGDVVTALFQPLSFSALGATGKNEEVNFEAPGITLAQALGRAGGLKDDRSNPQGVFVFRFEPKNALAWPRQPVGVTPEGLVPVVYRIDLLDPASFFVMQSFPVRNKDVLYIANAPVAELQKFLNVIFTIAYPALTAVQITR
ncbi:capsular biosynthesis protein [Betaproteobacteria bacterium GR16-43]|nr:capsular biosynthesis protein [Betaproteobacteria bacterium GR16-43]